MVPNEKLASLLAGARMAASLHRGPYRAEWDRMLKLCHVVDDAGGVVGETPIAHLGAVWAGLDPETLADILGELLERRECAAGAEPG